MNKWIECKTTNCLNRKGCEYTIGALWCDKRSCMKNINGKCVHKVCPMENPEYKNPEQVAREVEKQMQDQLRMERELKNLK